MEVSFGKPTYSIDGDRTEPIRIDRYFGGGVREREYDRGGRNRGDRDFSSHDNEQRHEGRPHYNRRHSVTKGDQRGGGYERKDSGGGRGRRGDHYHGGEDREFSEDGRQHRVGGAARGRHYEHHKKPYDASTGGYREKRYDRDESRRGSRDQFDDSYGERRQEFECRIIVIDDVERYDILHVY